MIELNDLTKLCICKKCNKVYMPQIDKIWSGYIEEEYVINNKYCEKCTDLEG